MDLGTSSQGSSPPSPPLFLSPLRNAALAILIALLFLLVIVALQYPIVASVLIGILSFLFGSLFDRLVQPRKIKTKGQRGGQVGAVSPSRKKASELIISLKQFAAQLFLVFTNYLRCVFSILLDVLAGYGYKPIRSLICYGVTIIAFTALYYVLGKLSVSEALVFSVTSFHGRGFFPGNNISLSDPRVVLASIEAVVGLLIEISFIATFTQRFLGK